MIYDNFFKSNLRWQFIANIGQAFFGGIFLLVIGKLLGSANFGVYASIMAIVSVVFLVTEMRLHDVVTRDFCFLNNSEWIKQTDRYYIVDLLFLDIISKIIPLIFIILFSNYLITKLNFNSENTIILTIASIGFFLSRVGNNISIGIFRVIGRTDLIAKFTINDWLLRLALIIIVNYYTDLSVIITILIVSISSSIINIIQFTVAFRQLGRRMRNDFWHGWALVGATKRLSQAQRIILSNMGLSVSDLMAKDLDVVLLARILSEDKVGLYKMAKTAIQLLWRAIDPFYFAIMPEVQILWQQNKFAEINRLLARTAALLFGLAITLVLIGWGGAYWLAEKILGPSFAGVPQLILVMSPWVVICAPLIWGHPVCVAIGRPEYATYGSFISLLVGLISFGYFTAEYDLKGAALAWNLTISSGMLITATISGYKYRSMLNSRF